MRNLKSILLICLILLSFSVLQANEPPVNSSKTVSPSVKNDSPDVVGIVKSLFKRVFGRKNKVRANSYLPIVSMGFDKYEVSLDDAIISVLVDAKDPDGDTLLYKYTLSAGKIVGEGPKVVWDLSGVEKGTYALTIEIDDGCGCVKPITKTVKVVDCVGCDISAALCPQGVTITPSAENIVEGEMVVFTANAENLNSANPAYNWTISAGEIVSGQNTPNLIVKATPESGGKVITATVDFGEGCEIAKSAAVKVTEP